MIKTVIFDLGNVLVYFDHAQMIDQVAEACGADRGLIYETIISKGLGARYEQGLIETEEVFEELRKMSSKEVSYEDLFYAIGDIFTMNASMEPVIKALKEGGARLLILSNTCDAHISIIKQKFPIIHTFDAHVFSHEIKARKPDPAIYHKALELAGCSPQECFYIDDILEYVEAARAIGIDAEPFTGSAKCLDDLKARGLIS